MDSARAEFGEAVVEIRPCEEERVALFRREVFEVMERARVAGRGDARVHARAYEGVAAADEVLDLVLVMAALNAGQTTGMAILQRIE